MAIGKQGARQYDSSAETIPKIKEQKIDVFMVMLEFLVAKYNMRLEDKQQQQPAFVLDQPVGFKEPEFQIVLDSPNALRSIPDRSDYGGQ